MPHEPEKVFSLQHHQTNGRFLRGSQERGFFSDVVEEKAVRGDQPDQPRTQTTRHSLSRIKRLRQAWERYCDWVINGFTWKMIALYALLVAELYLLGLACGWFS